MDRIVDDYGPVVDGLENDIQEVEAEVFGGNANVSRRVYELSREVIVLERRLGAWAVGPAARVGSRSGDDGGLERSVSP
jgi:magnesium transporter